MNTMRKVLLFCCCVGLAASQASAAVISLDFDDAYYLGSISNPTPASPAADKERVQNLLTVALGTTEFIAGSGGGGASDSDYTRSLIFPVLPPVDDSCDKKGGNGNEEKAIGCVYFIQKYTGTRNQGNAYVWYIAGLGTAGDDLQTPVADSEGFQAGQWQAFGAGRITPVPEPGTFLLLALGLAVLPFRGWR
jgi:hypothetical protein